ncbi:asparagine synthase (glutamine-hydrolyzing) [Alicyclobacillaceae bacterium I2511]|nr:asparagine synthase (glutamine-hydrolyzing) [Alicyclobacillaceae bacterium I2511]
MCGICGLVNKQGQPVDRQLLQDMTAMMMHRGPDDDGYYASGPVGLGFRRLAIVDVAAGQQPLANEDESVWVVFNGEIYNHQQLRHTLESRGHRFRTQSDTEVIVHLYEEKGIAGVDDLRGMFAFAIFDLRRQTLHLARDGFGIKPLYYRDGSDVFAFASDIRSLFTLPQERPALRLQSLWDYLTFQYVPGQNTMMEGVYRLPPGHYLTVQDGSQTLHQYWSPRFRPDASRSLDDYVEGVAHHLKRAVGSHLQGEVPHGALLSSGLDSSLIAALMSERLGRPEALRTFSVGFEGSNPDMDELAIASRTAAWLGSEHHSVTVSARTFVDTLPRMLEWMEEPVADPSAFGLYFVTEVAAGYVPVVLSGEGADEVFGGYPIYHEPLSLRGFSVLPVGLKALLVRLARTMPYGMKGRSWLLRGTTPLERRFVGNAQVFSEEAKGLLLRLDSETGWPVTSFAHTDAIYRSTQDLDDVTRMQMVDLSTWLPGDILTKADKMTMANSVELRVPFLDRDLFEFAAAIPTRDRLAKGQTKYVLRTAAQRWLPAEVFNRPKLGFPVPYRQWLRGPLRPLLQESLASLDPELFNAAEMQRMVQEHQQGVRDHGRALWVLLTFALWQQIWLKGVRSRVPHLSPRVEVRRRRTESGNGIVLPNWPERRPRESGGVVVGSPIRQVEEGVRSGVEARVWGAPGGAGAVSE